MLTFQMVPDRCTALAIRTVEALHLEELSAARQDCSMARLLLCHLPPSGPVSRGQSATISDMLTLAAVARLPQKNNLTFRSGHYTGRGWEVQEYAQTLQEGIPNYGGQLGWYMVRVEQCIRCSPMHEESLTLSGSCVQGHVAEPLPDVLAAILLAHGMCCSAPAKAAPGWVSLSESAAALATLRRFVQPGCQADCVAGRLLSPADVPVAAAGLPKCGRGGAVA